jgi:endonuclease/exonuclease/phosphatase family metal-dependent hydrolase
VGARYFRCPSLARAARDSPSPLRDSINSLPSAAARRASTAKPEKPVKLSICSCVLTVCALLLVAGSASAQSTDVVLHTSHARAFGSWSLVADATAADGKRLANADHAAAKLTAPLAQPANYFEMDFQAQAGVTYRLWIRGKAEKDFYGNDSAFVQFSDSVTATGAAQFRIGSTSATIYTIEDCGGCHVAGWGWNDNFYGATTGDLISFASSGAHTVRVQVREDGLSIDQIVLSPVTYKTIAPGALKNDTIVLPETTQTAAIDPAADVVLYAAHATTVGKWSVTADATAAGGTRLANPDAGAAKILTASAAPANYFEMQFPAAAGVAYRLWIRGKAQNNYYGNDSVHVQFSDSVTAAGGASYRIGTTSSTVYTVEDCNGCGVSGWGWNDNFYGTTPGERIYFGATGIHTMRVQVREDGLSIDQIVLSPVKYAVNAPGAPKSDTAILAASGGSTDPVVVDPLIVDPIVTEPIVQPPAGNLPPVFESGADGFRIGSLQGAMTAPATILFTASATGPEATDTLTYTWNFGDGTPAESHVQTTEASRQNPVHTYTRGGTFTATVTITDQAGNSISRSGELVVASSAVPAGAVTLKVMQLNSYKGRSTDTRVEQSKVWLQARWMAAADADVVQVQEVMGTNDANKYKTELEKVTGQTWNYFFRTDGNGGSSSAQGIAIFTRLPILTTASIAYTRCASADIPQRAAVAITVNVNGRNLTLIDTHLSSYSSSTDMTCRLNQAKELTAWAESLGSDRVITGDLNADPGEAAIKWFLHDGTSLYDDTWATPSGVERRTSYTDNPVAKMQTRSERIDYILTSKGSVLDLAAVQVPDTRDFTNDNSIYSQGKTYWWFHNAAPRDSDHETLIATFVVR